MRSTLAVCIGLFIGLAAPISGAETELTPEQIANAKPDRVLLTMNGDPAVQMAVTWRTYSEGPGVGQVVKSKDGPLLELDAREVTATVTQSVTITTGVVAHYKTVTFDQLEPSTRYAYRVGDGKVWSEWNQFETASNAPDPFTFIYMGDGQNDLLKHWSRAIREAYSHAPESKFILHAGDLINRANADNEWGEWFEAAGWINRVTPIIAIPGNHEHFVPKGSKERELCQFWRPQFEFPQNGLPNHRDTNYYLDYQGVRVIGLNSNKDHDKQAEWLDKVLSDNPNRWTILTFHHPVYSAAIRRDNPDLRDAWLDIIEKHKVDLVLQGHDHTYGRSQQISSGTVVRSQEDGSGSVYVVSVSGPKMYDLTETNREIMARVAEDTQLYQIIKVDHDQLNYEAYTVSGRLYDAFDLVKLPDGSSRLENRIPPGEENRRPATRDERK